MLTEEQIADGWIAHDGGPCPVEPTVLVRYKMRSTADDKRANAAGDLDWRHPAFGDDHAVDIIAYRPEPTP